VLGLGSTAFSRRSVVQITLAVWTLEFLSTGKKLFASARLWAEKRRQIGSMYPFGTMKQDARHETEGWGASQARFAAEVTWFSSLQLDRSGTPTRAGIGISRL
jgi:hypothetical protein